MTSQYSEITCIARQLESNCSNYLKVGIFFGSVARTDPSCHSEH